MKRSKKVFLLAPLTLSACGDSQYNTMQECEARWRNEPGYECKHRPPVGGHSSTFVAMHVNGWHGGAVPSVRYGYVPGASRGGFGVASRAFAVATSAAS